MSDWRLDEADEPEAPDEEIFGSEVPNPLEDVLTRIGDLVLHQDAESLDWGLFEEWAAVIRDRNDLAEAERYLRYLAA